MADPDPVYLSTLDVGGMRVLRSVLMKPEHEPYVPWLHARVERLTAAVTR